MEEITESTPVAMMTAGQLRDWLGLGGKDNQSPKSIQTKRAAEVALPMKRYVYGVKGIADLFGVSHVTAQRYKDTFLKAAVVQRGRKIVVDADRAMELFRKR